MPPVKPALKYLDDLLSRTLRSREAPPAQFPATIPHAAPPAVSDASKPALEAMLDKPLDRRTFLDYLRKGATAASMAGKVGALGRLPMPDLPAVVSEAPSAIAAFPNLNPVLEELVSYLTGDDVPSIPGLAGTLFNRLKDDPFSDDYSPFGDVDQDLMVRLEKTFGKLTPEERDNFIGGSEGYDFDYEDEDALREMFGGKISQQDVEDIDSLHGLWGGDDDYHDVIPEEFRPEDW